MHLHFKGKGNMLVKGPHSTCDFNRWTLVIVEFYLFSAFLAEQSTSAQRQSIMNPVCMTDAFLLF